MACASSSAPILAAQPTTSLATEVLVFTIYHANVSSRHRILWMNREDSVQQCSLKDSMAKWLFVCADHQRKFGENYGSCQAGISNFLTEVFTWFTRIELGLKRCPFCLFVIREESKFYVEYNINNYNFPNYNTSQVVLFILYHSNLPIVTYIFLSVYSHI